MIPWLDPHSTEFPPISEAVDDPNGLLAAGGDLSPARLITAYSRGIFPWFNPGEPILWWSPDPRCTLKPEKIHISRSLRKAIRKTTFDITFDRAFDEVIQACAAPRAYSEDTWISPEMQQAYKDLHTQGFAHSVELWQDGELCGGLYGIAMGRLFFGESMFSRRTNASKIAFTCFSRQLAKWGYALIDCQIENEHLTSLGAENIPRQRFQQYLNEYLAEQPDHSWHFDIDIDDVV
ncbi:leucyl/phenylalanyl-tRNA--protein transferase [Amphritea balenae]|uniref:Leucyl/phenylalanyl-tRNA--protein transferase n=1 Tax=Amphritea balenae TaxID=452629 RepID=A0A3P1SKV6_9GAMM|nr:leucyl/phenylalanyl-tRNA--protein transferase [Amphritea balenae]RRC97911.1 leucyl/phenylalanyl-tRNA--protein transferase [Amphritea balenae]GGK81678.1 leucyl/phenylalanyl-tRNA--protein transferase [Amphritea balenae]